MASSRTAADEVADSVDGPLAGLRVLELTNMIAAPFAGCLFADMGATVVKVEHPTGDALRQWPPHRDGRSLWWKVTNRNKRLITLDLSNADAQDLVRRMAPTFDVLIENFRPGTLERWNLTYEELSAANPRLVFVRVSGYGQSGPYSARPGYATIAEAMSGIPSFTGFPDRPPTLSAFPLGDTLAGVFAVVGALMAIYERDNGSAQRGQVVDVSLYESLFRMVETQVVAYDQLGVVKERNGNRMAEDSPRNTYETVDGRFIAISVGSDRAFSRLAAAIGQPELAVDRRFDTTRGRIENADILDSMIAEWFRAVPERVALDMLLAHDVVAGRIYDIADIMADEHYRARNDIISVQDPEFDTLKMVGLAPAFSRTPGRVRHTGGEIGQDNRWFYEQELGLSESELARLEQSGAI